MSKINKTLVIDIVYNFDEVEDTEDRELLVYQDTIKTAKEIATALESVGHMVNLVPVSVDNIDNILSKLKGDIVFNQAEEDVTGYKVLEWLEEHNKPVTGVDSAGFALSWDKSKTKELLVRAGVPTPKYFTIDLNKESLPDDLSYPLFVKAADDHGSVSITENSMVKNRKQLIVQIKWVKKTIGGASLVEGYIDGRELGVTVLGNGEDLKILPIKEIMFGKEFLNKPKVVTYDAKWLDKSDDYAGTLSMVCPAKLSGIETKAIDTAIRKSCRALNVRDYARFDIRLKNNVPYVVDYNANPAIGPNDASSLPAKEFGLSYPEFLNAIVMVALKRFVKG
jgi:D-alanine-D-alanine ligase